MRISRFKWASFLLSIISYMIHDARSDLEEEESAFDEFNSIEVWVFQLTCLIIENDYMLLYLLLFYLPFIGDYHFLIVAKQRLNLIHCALDSFICISFVKQHLVLSASNTCTLLYAISVSNYHFLSRTQCSSSSSSDMIDSTKFWATQIKQS